MHILILVLFSISLSSSAQTYSLEKRLELVRQTYSKHKRFRDFIGEILESSIEFSDDELEKFHIPKDLKKGISETQLIAIANFHEASVDKKNNETSFYDMMLEYTKKFDQFGEDPEKFALEVEALREDVKKTLSASKLKDSLTETFKATEPLELQTRFLDSDIKLLFTHPRFDPELSEGSRHFLKWGELNGKKTAIRKADNLLSEIIDQIDSAQKTISFNVYDNNLAVITDAMIKACRRGVKVTGGFSQGVMIHFEEVQALFEKLKAAKCKKGGSTHIYEVDSVGLNHQKILVIDEGVKGKAKVVLSSANYTKSGMHPFGDIGPYLDSGGKLLDKEGKPLSKVEVAKIMEKAVPNANHAVVIQSDELAQVVRHQLYYTLEMGFRGTEYPITGAYKFIDKKTGREMYLTFAPQGGLDNINKNFFGDMLRKSDSGEFTITMFAQSSADFSDQLLIALKKFQDLGEEVQLRVVADGPFALRDWSEFIKMIGFKANVDEVSGLVTYDLDPHGWRKELGEETIERFRKTIYIGSNKYGPTTTAYGKVGGEIVKFDIASKIHHKSPTAGSDLVTLASSFNISDGAESNNEIVTFVKDKKLTEIYKNANAYLAYESEADGRLLLNSVEERNLRNRAANKDVRRFIGELVELLKKEADNVAIDEKLKEIKRIIGDKKTHRLVLQLGDDLGDKQNIGQVIHFIFKFEENLINLSADKFNPEEILKMIEKERFQFKGVGWNELEWALKGERAAKEVLFVTKRDPEEVYRIFEILKEKGILKHIPERDNIIAYSKREDLEKIVGDRFEEVNKKGKKGYVDITSGDKKTQGKFHLAAYSDSNQNDLEFVSKSLKEKLAKGELSETKFAAFYNDLARPETWSFNEVLYAEDGKGLSREMEASEILEWKKNIFKSCTRYISPLSE